MNAAVISGFILVLAGVIVQNAWNYWHRKPLRWSAAGLYLGGTLLLTWGADMARQPRVVIVVAFVGCAILAVAGSLAFIAFMAEVKHQGWTPVIERMMGRERKS